MTEDFYLNQKATEDLNEISFLMTERNYPDTGKPIKDKIGLGLALNH